MNDSAWPAAPSTFDGEIAPGVGSTTSRTVRLLPRHRKIRYSYPVHESLLPALRRQRMALRRCPIPIHHTGYLCDRTKIATKAAIYKELGLKKIAQHPRDSRALLEVGRIFLHEGDHDRAARLFSRALRSNPLSSQAYYYFALALLRREQRGSARRVLQVGLRLFPRDADLLYLRSRVELELGRHLEAVAWLSRAMRRMPDKGSAFLHASALGGSNGPGHDGTQAAQ
jgi:tetratricopeptide (TPR) repeat protein